MSAGFSHAIRFEIADKNPITPVRQSAKRTHVPVILDAAELQRLFSELGLRERAMIILEALTGIRRSELMGLKWKDVDFIGGRIEITRSVVDQIIGKCKTEASQKWIEMALLANDTASCRASMTILSRSAVSFGSALLR